jgi:hypothetical protein
VAFELVGVYKLGGAAFRTGGGRVSRIDLKLMAAGEAEVGRIVANAAGETFVVRVIGILLGSGFVDVVGVAV